MEFTRRDTLNFLARFLRVCGRTRSPNHDEIRTTPRPRWREPFDTALTGSPMGPGAYL